MKNKLIIEQVKDLTRAPYAFPGGYPKLIGKVKSVAPTVARLLNRLMRCQNE